MKKPGTADHNVVLIAQLAAAVSIASFFFYLRHGDLLLYGDAVAHINIARRVFDSRTPGLLQLGTVWLPLPHLLMLPFIASGWMWRTGIGGSIPSLFAYVLSVAGIFRLVRNALGAPELVEAKFAAWLAAAIFALNPNLIYLQTTAMTEPVYLAFFIWGVVFFSEFVRDCEIGGQRKPDSSLTKCGLCLAGACLTRYDGWLLAALISFAAWLLALRPNFLPLRPSLKRKIKNLMLLAVVAPGLWLAYNAAVYRNPLEFANGPYSAKAIEQKTAAVGAPPHPGTRNLPVAFRYFFKSAELNVAEGTWQIVWICALVTGTAIVLLFQRRLWPLLLLWTPVPFYMLSIAYSGVPIFVPVWWPFSRYNVRYGIEMLPAFAVFTAVAAYGLMRFAATNRAKLAIAAVFLLLGAASYVQVFRGGPVSFQEAVVNSTTRTALESKLASEFEKLPSNSTFLMYLGDHVGAFQQAGIPLSRVINEGNHRPWKRPADPEGLWERALQHPAAYADFVIAFDSDVVASTVVQSELAPVEIVRVSGQPQATIYRTVKSSGNQTR
jgi:dolichyl-phosphate-mannose-protein mannosyltransferase